MLRTPLFLLAALAPAVAVAAPPSPQRFALEIKFGPYVPAIDSSAGLNGATPFSDLFGDFSAQKGESPSRGLLSQVEFDYQFLRRFGILGVGVSAGYYRMTARQPLYFTQRTGAENGPLSTCQVKAGAAGGPRQYVLNGVPQADPNACFSLDQNIFNVVPLAVMAVYRFDYLDRRWRVPIIPYAKVGLGYYIWWMGTSGEFVTHRWLEKRPDGYYVLPRDQAEEASGASLGVVLNPGLAIDLGAIDRQAERIMDQETGINRITLFCEMHYAWMNGFGAANKLDLSDLTFNVGIGFEF